MKHEHVWKDTVTELGLIGNMYGYLFPWVCCQCGALMNHKKQVLDKEDVERTLSHQYN